MHEFKRTVIILLGLVIMLVPVAYLGYLTFTNIDMTKTRLLVTYWREFLISFVVEIYGAYLLEKGLNRM